MMCCGRSGAAAGRSHIATIAASAVLTSGKAIFHRLAFTAVASGVSLVVTQRALVSDSFAARRRDILLQSALPAAVADRKRRNPRRCQSLYCAF
jgi:hypothetical protein